MDEYTSHDIILHTTLHSRDDFSHVCARCPGFNRKAGSSITQTLELLTHPVTSSVTHAKRKLITPPGTRADVPAVVLVIVALRYALVTVSHKTQFVVDWPSNYQPHFLSTTGIDNPSTLSK